jgi:hypothetical protein
VASLEVTDKGPSSSIRHRGKRRFVGALALLLVLLSTLAGALPANADEASNIAALRGEDVLRKYGVLDALGDAAGPAYEDVLVDLIEDPSEDLGIQRLAAILLQDLPNAHAVIIPILADSILASSLDAQTRARSTDALLAVAKSAFDRSANDLLAPLRSARAKLGSQAGEALGQQLDATVQLLEETGGAAPLDWLLATVSRPQILALALIALAGIAFLVWLARRRTSLSVAAYDAAPGAGRMDTPSQASTGDLRQSVVPQHTANANVDGAAVRARSGFDLNDLSGPQRAMLREALLLAFDRDPLDQMLQDHDRNKRLQVLVTDSNLRDQVFELVKLTQDQGWTDNLVAWAQQARPDHARISNLTSDLRLLEGIEARRETPEQSSPLSLERTIKAYSDSYDFAEWLEKLTRLRGKVCRVEDPRDPRKALGTGFLVGPNMVLTNHHVLVDYLVGDRARDTTELAFRFDFAIESDGERAGKTILAAASNWLVSYASSTEPSSPDPKSIILDYALVRLASDIGKETVAGGMKRGWFELSTIVPVPVADDAIFILQHPRGEPLKLATGSVLAASGIDGHLHYNAETQGGSSGSPCLNTDLKVVALHRGSLNEGPAKQASNEGVPIDAIISHLAARGTEKFWS